MKNILIIFVLLHSITVSGESFICGKVLDRKGETLVGANVFFRGTFKGVATDRNGEFELSTDLAGKQYLVVAFIGYTTFEQELNLVGDTVKTQIVLANEAQQIADVVIRAGSFEASDKSKSITLQPLDIVTTPSAAGDIYGALATLPGAATVGEDGRLFVRGGDGYETKTFIDGLLSKKPYNSSVPDLPSRGRFSPFLLSGTTFSTGGYSAEYGQALSSALILTSNGFPKQSQTELSIMSIGAGISQVMKGERSSLSLGLDYSNLGPYMHIAEQRFEMSKYPETIGASLVARKRVGTYGMLKIYSRFTSSRLGLNYPNYEDPGAFSEISIGNQNSYTNVSFTTDLDNSWVLKAGVAMTFDFNNLDMDSYLVDENAKNVESKITLSKEFSDKVNLKFGVAENGNFFMQHYRLDTSLFENKSEFNDFTTSAFSEITIRPLSRIAIKGGIRSEYSSILNKGNIAGRLSGAFQINEFSQISMAYGNFYQTPEENLLRFTHDLQFELADHYILNYSWERDDRVIRVETYYKDYKRFVTYNGDEYWDGTSYTNDGDGYSRGVDLFYRDRKTVKYLEYWLSYSYVDSKRKYRDYPSKVTPSFVPKHTTSLVGKYWISKITTQVGLSFTLASGRPYNNPNNLEFMDSRTDHYSDLSINVSHLTTLFGCGTILYMSVSNVLGRDNIYGYRYSTLPNGDGVYHAFPVKAGSKRFYFVGLFITI